MSLKENDIKELKKHGFDTKEIEITKKKDASGINCLIIILGIIVAWYIVATVMPFMDSGIDIPETVFLMFAILICIVITLSYIAYIIT